VYSCTTCTLVVSVRDRGSLFGHPFLCLLRQPRVQRDMLVSTSQLDVGLGFRAELESGPFAGLQLKKQLLPFQLARRRVEGGALYLLDPSHQYKPQYAAEPRDSPQTYPMVRPPSPKCVTVTALQPVQLPPSRLYAVGQPEPKAMPTIWHRPSYARPSGKFLATVTE
jgi:hypothetical protein